jgi:hypothetical protein
MTASPQAMSGISAPMMGAGAELAPDAPRPSEADAGQVELLEAQLKTLAAKAAEIDELARRLNEESHGEASAEVDQAHYQAQAMRGAVEFAKGELNAAPTDRRTGNKRVSSASISRLSVELGHVMHTADHEKTALTQSITEARSSNASSTPAKTAPSIVKTITQTARQVTHATTVAVVGPPVFEVVQPTWALRATQMVSETRQRIVESLGQVSNTISTTAVEWGGAVADGARELWHDTISTGKKAAAAVAEGTGKLVDSYIVAPARTAANAMEYAAKRTYGAISDTASSVWSAAQSGYEATKKMAKNLLPFGEKEGEVTISAPPKPKPAAPQSNMANAIKQALACTLPLGLACTKASPSAALSPSIVPDYSDISTIAAYVGA